MTTDQFPSPMPRLRASVNDGLSNLARQAARDEWQPGNPRMPSYASLQAMSARLAQLQRDCDQLAACIEMLPNAHYNLSR
jgi:hypothetical protein